MIQITNKIYNDKELIITYSNSGVKIIKADNSGIPLAYAIDSQQFEYIETDIPLDEIDKTLEELQIEHQELKISITKTEGYV